MKVIKNMVLHESAGGFLFYRNLSRHFLYVALLQDSDLAVIIPKGHIEKGETPEQAAIREIQEELGIKIKPKIVKKIGIDKYNFRIEGDNREHQKKVHLFALKIDRKRILRPLRNEGFIGAKWYLFDEAMEEITFDKKNLILARKTLFNKNL